MIMKSAIPFLTALLAFGFVAQADDAAKHGSTVMNSGVYAARGGEDRGVRVLFLGNSITLHGPLPSVGWTNDWGMAASSAEKDFVHIVTRGIEDHFGKKTSVMVRNLADFERNYRNWSMTNLAEAVAFDPQVLVIALGENVSDLKTDNDREDYRQAFRRLCGCFLDGKRTKPITAVRGVFWPNAAKDAAMASAAGDYALPFVKADVFAEPGMSAKDAGWAHAGVAAHPGDKGMAEIARRILETLFPTDCGFAATVDGKAVKVRPIRISAMEFNRWPVERWQRPVDQTEVAGMVTVESDGATEWAVRPSRAFTNAVVRPSSAGVKCEAKDGEVRFTLPRNGYFTLELDGFHRPLQMFVEPKRDFAAEKKSATMYFGPGNHYAGEIRLKSHDRVYIDRDAYVYGMFGIEDAEDVAISGYGVICGSIGRRHDLECYGGVNATPLWAVRSKNVKVCGPTVIDSACWCVATFGCRDVELSHLKVTGAWRYNTDGVDICNSENVWLHDSFVHSFDDSIVIKGMPLYRRLPVGDVRVERCVCWCGWGGTLETGLETWASSWRNVTFEDCDLIHNSMAALRLHLGGPCKVENTTYRNIRIEYDSSEREPEIHRDHDDRYTKRDGSVWVGNWLSIHNYKMYAPGGLYKNPDVGPDEPHGTFGKVTYEDIDILVEPGVPMPGQSVRFSEGTSLGEVEWRGVRLNGRLIELKKD